MTDRSPSTGLAALGIGLVLIGTVAAVGFLVTPTQVADAQASQTVSSSSSAALMITDCTKTPSLCGSALTLTADRPRETLTINSFDDWPVHGIEIRTTREAIERGIYIDGIEIVPPGLKSEQAHERLMRCAGGKP